LECQRRGGKKNPSCSTGRRTIDEGRAEGGKEEGNPKPGVGDIFIPTQEKGSLGSKPPQKKVESTVSTGKRKNQQRERGATRAVTKSSSGEG